MGTDISMNVEKKVKDKWIWQRGINPDDYFEDEIDVGRDYTLFSALADLRNEEENHDEYIKPFSQPRGFPEDGSPELEERMEDLHSISYYLLSELLAFDWDQVVLRYGRKMPLREHCSYALAEIEKQKKPSETGDGSDVRLVFGFDC